MNQRLWVIVQARMGGERFPGKVLAPLLGQPMLLWQLERLSRAVRLYDGLVVICPKEDEALQEMCARHGFLCRGYDGPVEDVLGRYMQAAEEHKATDIVRVTGDCPLIDPAILERLLYMYNGQMCDHVGVAAEWPDGQDMEAFTFEALKVAHAKATAPSDREHVTPYMWQNTEMFQCKTLPCPFDLSHQQYSVDTEADLRVVTRILRACLDQYGSHFGWQEIAHVLRQPSLQALHDTRLARNHKYLAQRQAEGTSQAETWAQVRYEGRLDGSNP